MKLKQKGFTLIELIVVMAIIAILVLIAAPKFMGYTEKAKLTQVINDIKVSEKAAEQYYLRHDAWPRDQTATAYTDEQLTLWVDDFRNLSGETVTLEDGKYYDVDWELMKQFMAKPDNDFRYIIQNPVGDIYYANDLTPAGEQTKLSGIDNFKPTAKISTSPESGFTTQTNIVWSFETSTDPDDDEITEAEWQGEQTIYNTAGTYTVKLRVKDSKGLWSDWTEKNIIVENANVAPVAAITMTPETNLFTNTNIVWSYSGSTDPDGDLITNAEWQAKQNIYVTAGSYTVKLRVQDEHGLWSEWVEKTFTVAKPTYTVLGNVGTYESFSGINISVYNQAYSQYKTAYRLNDTDVVVYAPMGMANYYLQKTTYKNNFTAKTSQMLGAFPNFNGRNFDVVRNDNKDLLFYTEGHMIKLSEISDAGTSSTPVTLHSLSYSGYSISGLQATRDNNNVYIIAHNSSEIRTILVTYNLATKISTSKILTHSGNDLGVIRKDSGFKYFDGFLYYSNNPAYTDTASNVLTTYKITLDGTVVSKINTTISLSNYHSVDILKDSAGNIFSIVKGGYSVQDVMVKLNFNSSTSTVQYLGINDFDEVLERPDGKFDLIYFSGGFSKKVLQ